MNRRFLAAAALTALSLVGYVAGVLAPYPGREATLVGVMVGVTLVAVTYSGRTSDSEHERTDGTPEPSDSQRGPPDTGHEPQGGGATGRKRSNGGGSR